MPPKMPGPVVAWLANVLFVVFAVLVAFMTLRLMIAPPRSFDEGLFEAHKIILVGGVTLAGVAIVEAFLLAHKLTDSNVVFLLWGLLGLFFDALFGALLFSSALLHGANSHGNAQIDLLQFVLGLVVLIVAVFIALRFKYVECHMSDLARQAKSHSNVQGVGGEEK
jgi:hypothetical protein